MRAFASQAGAGAYSAEQFQREFPHAPPRLVELYAWAHRIGGTEEVPLMREGAFRIAALEDIAETTRRLDEIKRREPENQWRSGFIRLQGWDDSYNLVVDTGGALGAPGRVLYYDYGGGMYYWISYPSYEAYLNEIVGLVERGKYFPAKREAFGGEFEHDWKDLLSERTIESIECE